MKPQEELKSIFTGLVSSVNIFSPHIDCYLESGPYVCELSHGNGIGKYLYGVTVVDGVKKEKRDDLSTCFIEDEKQDAYNRAIEYVESLKEKNEEK